MLSKLLFTFLSVLCTIQTLWAQPANDACVNAQVITIPASGNICINSTNTGATSDLTTNGCDTGAPGNEVWYTFVATGTTNSVTITPSGGATSMVASFMTGGCTTPTLLHCGAAVGTAVATTSFAVTPGTQIWISVESNGVDGNFQACFNSLTPPPIPGGSCATASTLCTKNNFTVSPYPVNAAVITPACFPTPFQRPLFYKFTVGLTGSLAFLVDPLGNVEYDWVLYNISGGCPGTEVCCNFNFGGALGDPMGMQTTGTEPCGSSGFNGAPGEISPSVNVTIGQTYLIVIDNYTDNNIGFNMSFGGTFEIAPNPEFTLTPAAGCAPQNVTITNTSTASVSYSWNLGNGNTSIATTPPVQTYPTVGTYIVSLTATSATGCTNTQTQNIVISSPSVNQPVNINVCAGAAVPATVFTGSAGATFSWTNNTPGIGLAASGAGNQPTFTAINAGTTDIIATIVVTPANGGCTGPTKTYTITIKPTPVNAVVTAVTQCAGTSVAAINFATNPVNALATFAWTNSNIATGLGASGTVGTPTFTGLNATSAAIVSTVTVTPTLNGCIGTPTNFTITIRPIPVNAVVTPITQCAGTSVAAINFATNPVNALATFSWTNSNVATGLGASGTVGTPTFTGLNATTAAIVSTATVTPTLSGCVGTPTNFTITINPLPVVTPVTNITQCTGLAVPATPFASTPTGATFAWTNSNTVIGLAASGTGNQPTFIAANPGAASIFGTVTITPTLAGCVGTATTYTITVGSLPVLNPLSAILVCAGDAVPASNITTTPAGATINWTNSNTAVGIPASGTANFAAFTANNVTTVNEVATMTATPSFGSCIGVPGNFTITVKPTPSLPAMANVVACAGAAVPASNYISMPVGASNAWTNSNIATGLAASGIGNYASFTATNAGAVAIVSNISVTPTLNACVGLPQTYTITINPLPTITPNLDQVYCAGAAATASAFASNMAGTTYAWTNSQVSTGLAASGASNYAGFTTVNASAAAVVSSIVVTPTAATCVGATDTYTITVNPTPAVVAGNNGPLCAGAALNLTANAIAGATYAWTGPNAFVSAAQNPTIAVISVANSGVYTVTTTFNGCTATTTTTLTITPVVTPTITAAGPFCIDATATNLSASIPGGTWSGNGIIDPAAGSFDPSLATAGNNTITYTISGLCGTSVTSVIVINALPVLTMNVSPSGCLPLLASFGYTSNPVSTNLVWDFGDGNSTTATAGVNNTYTSANCFNVTLTGTTAAGCSSTITQNNFICAFPYAVASFGTSSLTATITEPAFQFTNSSVNATGYNWSFGTEGSSSLTNPAFTFSTNPGTHLVTLIAQNAAGCNDTTSITVTIEDELIYYVPNTFTPDDDVFNPTFKPIFTSGFDPYVYNLLIFDRWGEILFESKNYQVGWDGTYGGKFVQDGTYIWVIRFNNSITDKRYEVTGHVNIIR